MVSRRDTVLLLVAAALGAGCGASDDPAPPRSVPIDVEGVDPTDLPRDLTERGRRPAETFCDGPRSTSSSC